MQVTRAGEEALIVERVLALLLGLLVSVGALAAPPRPHIVLLSLDTTRADALSCYGRPPDVTRPLAPWTPNLDALAEAGVRFERFYAHAPTTLNSHATMLTGLDPHQHGVPRNGFPLPDGVPTLAERLAGLGYDTVGVIGASALDGEMGLGRGFRVWDDELSLQLARQYEDRAEGVVDRTLRRLDGLDPDRPLFLFVHVFDAHGPFEAPGEWRERLVAPERRGQEPSRRALARALRDGTADPAAIDHVASLYLGEVAYADHHLGRLLGELERRGFLERAVVVATADHGEVLSETPRLAWTHGAGVDDGETRVPLIVRGYGLSIGARRVVERQAGMASLAPTLERLAGAPRTLGTAPDLWDLIRPGPVWDTEGWPERPVRPVLQEATQPLARERKDAWNNLDLQRGVRLGEAFARTGWGGRGPLRVRRGSPVLLPLLRSLLEAWDSTAPPWRGADLSDPMRRALEALGYLESDSDAPGDDPSNP